MSSLPHTSLHPAEQASYAALQKAAEWYALLGADDATEQDRANWRAWLAQRPEHHAAWQTIEKVSRRFAPLQEDSEASGAALKAARSSRLSRRRAIDTLGVLFGSGILGWLAWRHTPLQENMVAWTADYHTSIGEIREFTLNDGSRIWLNTASALNVDYTATARRLHIVAGEVLFSTGKAEVRPFIVETRHGSMRALGTRFTVRQHADQSGLFVHEGAVEIHTADRRHVRIVHAGEQAVFSQEWIGETGIAPPAREAWSRGLLIADNMTLKALSAELARYRRGHLGVAPQIADLRVIGTYPLHDTDQALAMLEDALPVRVNRALPWWVSIDPAAEKR